VSHVLSETDVSKLLSYQGKRARLDSKHKMGSCSRNRTHASASAGLSDSLGFVCFLLPCLAPCPRCHEHCCNSRSWFNAVNIKLILQVTLLHNVLESASLTENAPPMPVRVSQKTNYSFHILGGVRSRAVGWRTALQAGKSQIRFKMEPLRFFIDILLLATLWPWNRLSL
jgi:hypothetical protein